MTFSKLIQQFEETSIPLMKASSASNVRSELRLLRERFGDEPVSGLTAPTLQRFFVNLSKTHQPSTIHHLWVTMRLVLAQELEKIPKPKLPKIRYTEQPWLSTEQMKSLIEAAAGKTKLLVYLAAETGMRIGEIQALKFSDANFAEKTLSIRRNFFRNVIDTPKSFASNRTICVSERLLDMLEVHKMDKYVVGGEKPLPLPTAAGWLHILQDRLGMPRSGFHAFRRGSSTLMGRLGVPETVAAYRLGHRLPGITYGLYAQRVHGMDREWLEKIAEALA